MQNKHVIACTCDVHDSTCTCTWFCLDVAICVCLTIVNIRGAKHGGLGGSQPPLNFGWGG